jgi:D-amino peptidase
VRVLIMSDMEGVAGITKWEQVIGGANGAASQQYMEGRRLYTGEINAAVRGAREAGAEEILVMDCHGAGHGWTFGSLLLEELDPTVEIITQRQWTDYTEALEDGCDAAMFVGAHAMAGTPEGGLCHTVYGSAWRDVRLNGTSVGECGINAALAGTWGCPPVLVTGDQAVCRETRELFGDWLTTVQVKRSYGVQSARHKAPEVAREMIAAGAKRALENLDAARPYLPGKPCTLEIEAFTVEMVEQFRHHEFVEIAGPTTLRIEGDDWWTAWRRFFFNYIRPS